MVHTKRSYVYTEEGPRVLAKDSLCSEIACLFLVSMSFYFLENQVCVLTLIPLGNEMLNTYCYIEGLIQK